MSSMTMEVTCKEAAMGNYLSLENYIHVLSDPEGRGDHAASITAAFVACDGMHVSVTLSAHGSKKQSGKRCEQRGPA